jgi:hypothetical protein
MEYTYNTNWRLQGHDYIRIMATRGHKTRSTFRGYNPVSPAELKTLVSSDAKATSCDININIEQ